MKNIGKKTGGYLRAAVWEDMDLLFEWANDLSVRKNSFSTEEIVYEEHRLWYQGLLQDGDRKQYLYIRDGVPAGQARVAVSGKEAEISYSVCAAQRGKGYGKEILKMLPEQVKKDFPGVKCLIGKVKTENIPSQKAFLGAGYQKEYEVYIERV